MRYRIAMFAAAVMSVVVLSVPAGAGPTYAVSRFGPVPSPGHPFGVLPTKSGVYVMTSDGQPFRQSSGTESIFRYALSGGAPIGVTRVAVMSKTMGLFDAAEDSSGRIYVVDMNGRILRYTPTAHGLTHQEVYASIPEPYMTIGWQSSMWMCLTFDEKGNLFVTDQSQGAIWKIPPNREPAVWFRSPELLSIPMGALNGLAIGPGHKLYLAQVTRADNGFASEILRLPLTEASPAPTDLEVFHTYAFEPQGHPTPIPGPTDLAFGRSGNLYVTLGSADQLSVLDPAGREIKRISDDAFAMPLGVRFLGNSLLLANSNDIPPYEPATSEMILKVDVGEPGLALPQPVLP